MNQEHKAIRESIKSMSPQRAIDHIKLFKLREDEESVLIEIDVNGLSYAQFQDQYHVTPEVIKSRRRQAFAKIVDAIKYEREKSGG